MYTEEELLEAVDILMEDYGFSEEEAVELVLEECMLNEKMNLKLKYREFRANRTKNKLKYLKDLKYQNDRLVNTRIKEKGYALHPGAIDYKVAKNISRINRRIDKKIDKAEKKNKKAQDKLKDLNNK